MTPARLDKKPDNQFEFDNFCYNLQQKMEAFILRHASIFMVILIILFLLLFVLVLYLICGASATESGNEEYNNIRWKNTQTRKWILSYREWLYSKYNVSTAQLYLTAILTVYRHFEITIPPLPYFSKKGLKHSTPINYDDLPDRELLREVLQGVSPLVRALILFMSSSGVSRIDVLNLTIHDYLDATQDYHNSDSVKKAIKEMRDEDIIPTFQLTRQKTGTDYFTFCSHEAVKSINAYTKTVTTTNTTTKKTVNTYWDKYGRSPDKKKIMAIGRISAPNDRGTYANFYEMQFLNKCPHCGKATLTWGIYWAGNETKNWGKFPATGRTEGGSAEGHIFCTHCDADYSVQGNEHIRGGKKLKAVTKLKKSSKTKAYTLKKGKLLYATKTVTVSSKQNTNNQDRYIRAKNIPASVKKTIRETVTGQEFLIGYTGEWEDQILEIDCEDRICWLRENEDDTDPVNLNKYVDYNSDWFVLKGDYNFEGIGCMIRTVEYQERW